MALLEGVIKEGVGKGLLGGCGTVVRETRLGY